MLETFVVQLKGRKDGGCISEWFLHQEGGFPHHDSDLGKCPGHLIDSDTYRSVRGLRKLSRRHGVCYKCYMPIKTLEGSVRHPLIPPSGACWPENVTNEECGAWGDIVKAFAAMLWHEDALRDSCIADISGPVSAARCRDQQEYFNWCFEMPRDSPFLNVIEALLLVIEQRLEEDRRRPTRLDPLPDGAW